MTGRLEGKVALVFGAGSAGPGWGNGKAAATLFAREGALVTAVDINREAAEETQRIIEGEGGQCAVTVCDVTRSDQIGAAVQACLSHWGGRIDVLHNNVGYSPIVPIVDTTDEELRAITDANYTSTYMTCRAVLPIMKAQGGGAIVNIGSIAPIRWLGYTYAAYSAAKAGVIGFTKAAAMEHVRDKIRINVILPGMMSTPIMVNSLTKAFPDELEAKIALRDTKCPMGLWATPGTPPMPPCSWPRRRRATSPGSSFWWMAG